MLSQLHISNLAVIEDARLQLSEGLNCFTGQTGAGKSLIIGAFEILLGMKSGSLVEMLRPGSDEARVSGVFEIRDTWLKEEVSRLADQELAVGDELLITRRIFASGRSSVSINGQPATAGMVKQIGELLVDIHGRHDHQFLLKPSNQLLILDAFGKSLDVREEFVELYQQRRELTERLEELKASRTLRRQQLDLYEFQAGEIDDAQLEVGEYQELKARHDLVCNLSKIRQDAGNANAALYESEGSVVERLQMIVHLLQDLTEIDESLGEVTEQVRSSTLSLQEAAFELGRYTEQLEIDPGELAEIEDRLNVLNRLIAKYADAGQAKGEDQIQVILEYREQIGREIDELRRDDADFEHIDQEITELDERMKEVGDRLTKARQAAAKKICPSIEGELKQLSMGEAQFKVEFSPAGDNGQPGATGYESAEMMIRTNPGQPARPLRKVASSGEMSRIMLAIKSIVAHADRISVLVFDEIDANIGGRLGTVIGQKLRKLANPPTGQRHQILCITHLPQIAAFANQHLHIRKTVDGKGKAKQTRTTVNALEGDGRVDELAEMLAGKDVTATTRRQVREMIDSAGG